MQLTTLPSPRILYYCTAGTVVRLPIFSVGDVVGITQNNTNSQIIMIPNPKRIKPFLVPQRFFSNRSMLPNMSAIYAEKYTTAHHIHKIANPIRICFPIVFVEISK